MTKLDHTFSDGKSIILQFLLDLEVRENLPVRTLDVLVLSGEFFATLYTFYSLHVASLLQKVQCNEKRECNSH